MFRINPLSCAAFAAVFLALSLGCSTSASEQDQGEPPANLEATSSPAVVASPPDATHSDQEMRQSEAIELVAAGEYKAARDLLGELLIERELVEAKSWLQESSPEDALVAVDRALALDPENAESVHLKARASFALAEKAASKGGPGSLVIGAYEDALHYFERGGDEVPALLGASRSAFGLQRYSDALAYAKRAVEKLDAAEIEPVVDPKAVQLNLATQSTPPDGPLYVDVAPERVLAEAAYRAFVEAKQTDPESATTQELFRETEDALDRLLGRDSGTWTWSTLVDLYLWQGDLVAAKSQAENGLDRNPNDAELIDRLAKAAHQAGGPTEMAATFAAFNARHAGSARGQWYEGQGLFDQATDLVMPLVASAITGAGEEDVSAECDSAPALFAQAEEVFRRCRETDPEFESACLGYEALTFSGRGWYLFARDQLPEAIASFQAMEDVYPGGLFAELEGRLLSGVQGIAQVGGAYNERADWRRAGDAFRIIAKIDKSRSTWANNQGFFYRDAGVELETLGRKLCSAAREGRRDEALLEELARLSSTNLVDAEAANPSELMRRASNAAMQAARAVMQLSWEGYQLAVELAPDDVRIVNDAGLVQVYYLHTELEAAKKLLERAVELGQEQMTHIDELDETQSFELANAYGDAFQNLGVLAANHEDNPEAAIAFFERSIEIGPEPRPLLTNFWLPFLRGELESEDVPDELRLKTWAAPCTE